jgi:hypothetical protein
MVDEFESKPVVRYQELIDGEGLAFVGNVLSAYKGGVIVAENEVAEHVSLRELMLEYLVLALLPKAVFSHSQPKEFDVEITLSVLALPGENTGTITINGEDEMWVARRNAHPDFRCTDKVVLEGRPWAKADNSDGWGWEFLLPAFWQTYPDLLVPKRLALALEAFLDDIASGRELPNPYRRHFNNLFSAASPAWRINLPRIISIDARAASELI